MHETGSSERLALPPSAVVNYYYYYWGPLSLWPSFLLLLGPVLLALSALLTL